jgi:hypothetical protein
MSNGTLFESGFPDPMIPEEGGALPPAVLFLLKVL